MGKNNILKRDTLKGLETILEELPITWYPRLLEIMIKASYKKQVWVAPEGASYFVSCIEKVIFPEEERKG